MSRNKARVVAMQALFQLDGNRDGFQNVLEQQAEEEHLDATDLEYLCSVTNAVIQNCDNIDERIRRYSIDWDISRLGRVERAILRLAIGEILYADDVPVSVAINEAVKLSKKFGSEQAARFINGVLGEFSRGLEDEANK